ncbi:MAG TPA: hypothetical protein VG936_16730 [Lacunisphaera sp.]|nr:hypothetical protein [Lacunisphaera sp.]
MPTRMNTMRVSPWAILLIAALLPAAHAQTNLVTFAFTDQSSPAATLAPTAVASHLSVGSFTVSDGAFTSTNFTTGSPPDAPAVADGGGWTSTTPAKYFAFTITPDAGYQFDVTAISFDYRQTSTGPANYQVDVGLITNVLSGSFLTDSAWHAISSIVDVEGLASPQQVRIYGFNGGSGSFGLDSVVLTGSVTAVPEPAAMAAGAGIVMLVAAVKRRRARPPRKALG